MDTPPPDIAARLAAIEAALVRLADRPAVVPQLLGQEDAHAYCGVSRAVWFRLRSAGKVPKPVSVPGSGLRWRRADLDRWLAGLKPARGRARVVVVEG